MAEYESNTATNENAASGGGKTMRDQARHTADAARQEVEARGRQWKGRLERTATEQLRRRKDDAADQIHIMADSVRSVRDQLQDKQAQGPASYVNTAADQMDAAAEHIHQRDVNDLMCEVENEARRRPAAFLGAAIVSGVVVGRFLHSSVERRRQGERVGEQSHDGGAGAAQPPAPMPSSSGALPPER